MSTSTENPPAELWATDHETGREHYIETGDLLTLHVKAMGMVAAGKDAWTKPVREHPESTLESVRRLRLALAEAKTQFLLIESYARDAKWHLISTAAHKGRENIDSLPLRRDI